MRPLPFLVSAVIGAFLLTVGFQNCSDTSFQGATLASQNFDVSIVDDPDNPGGRIITPPKKACVGSPSPASFDALALQLQVTTLDPAIVFAEGLLNGSAPGGGVYAQRFAMRDNSGAVIFGPGSSYSPLNPSPGTHALAIGYAAAGILNFEIGPQNTQTITTNRIRGTVFPLCIGTKIKNYRYKSDGGSATSGTPMTYDITLTEPSQLMIASEKTVINATSLGLDLRVQNMANGLDVACPVFGANVYNSSGNSTPSVSAACTVTLAAGTYRVSNVITTNATTVHGASQHLGIIVLKP